MSAGQPELDAKAFLADRYDVPRETLDRLQIYADLLDEWQMRMNLVAPSTLPVKWDRHFLDSAQLIDHIPTAGRRLDWIDLGAGAGFPALVIAILRPQVRMTMVESRQKKCAFLQHVAEQTGVADRVKIQSERIEALPEKRFDVVSARALADLSQLFDWGRRFADNRSCWLLPKGANVEAEISQARQHYEFEVDLQPSLTDPSGRIVIARSVRQRKNR